MDSFDYHRYQPRSSQYFCKANQKATQVASDAATVAKAAMDAQPGAAEAASQEVKIMLADRAQLAADAASEVLEGKKLQLDGLSKRMVENRYAIEEGQRAIAASACNVETVMRIRDNTRRDLDNMLGLLKEQRANQEDIHQLMANAEREEEDRQSLLEAAERRVEELNTCMKQAQEDLEGVRESAKKANCAAEEARQRIDTLRRLVPKIKKLKRMDSAAMGRFLRRRRRIHHLN